VTRDKKIRPNMSFTCESHGTSIRSNVNNGCVQQNVHFATVERFLRANWIMLLEESPQFPKKYIVFLKKDYNDFIYLVLSRNTITA